MTRSELIEIIMAIPNKFDFKLSRCVDEDKSTCLVAVCAAIMADINDNEFFAKNDLRTYLLIRY